MADGAARDVVLITVDTWRYDAVPWHQGIWATPAPALERLAKDGRIFTFAHAHNTVTLPSHANILSGQYPYSHGVRDNAGFVVPAGVETLATWLAGRGFATGAFVSAFPLDARFGLARGFEVYDDRVAKDDRAGGAFQISERRGDSAVAAATTWWQANAGRRRFLWLHLFDPHAPYEPPEPFRTRFAEWPYRGEVAAVDAFLQGLLATFASGDRGSRPLVALTADHGESLGEHGESSHGFLAYGSTLRVPLLLWGPGVSTGRDERLARHIDIAPTLLIAAGFPELARPLPGRDLLRPLPADEVETSYFEALSGHFSLGWAPIRGMIRGRDKYIEKPLPEFYDLAIDPQETRNLAASDRRRLHAVRYLLPADSSWPPPRLAAVAPEVAATLRSLGYLSEGAPRQTSYGPEDDPSALIGMVADLQNAETAFAAGHFGDAAKLARGVIARRPKVPAAHSLLARSLLEGGHATEALAVMKAAVEGRLASLELTQQYGLALIEAGRPGEAVALLGDPARSADAGVLSVLGVAQVESGQPRLGRETLLQALAKAPGDAATLERLSAVALSLGNVEEARDRARQAVERDPQAAFAWNNLGVALYLSGQRREGVDAWRQAVAVNPRLWDTWFNLGLKAAEMGDIATARRALRTFIEQAPRRYAADQAKARAVLGRLPPG